MTSTNSVIVYAPKKIQNRKKRARIAKQFRENEAYNQSNNWVVKYVHCTIAYVIDDSS